LLDGVEGQLERGGGTFEVDSLGQPVAKFGRKLFQKISTNLVTMVNRSLKTA